MRVARDDWASNRMRDRRSPKGRGQRGRGGRPVGNGRRVWVPSRAEVVERLDRASLLPAIVFIFSRVGCDAAVQQCLNANLRLTTPEERDAIYQFVEEHCADIPEEDLQVLGYHEFLDGLTRGVAAHHAGMLPTFKECVEQLFLRGLCRVVFATETLALGINMPARSVVIEKLSKWNGETHADITPGEYTQLTGRAGRRGIDVEGHGVVLWQPGLEPKSVAGLASTRTYPLRSSFRPSYNMAVNLVRQFGREQARELLEQSFAQFQADKAVVGLARQLRKSDEALDGYAAAAACDRGDFMQYAALRRSLSDLEAHRAKARRYDRRREAEESVESLRPGDVIDVPGREVLGYRARDRPRRALRPGGSAALRAHAGPARASPEHGGLPDTGPVADPAEGAPELQRARPAGQARPRIDPAPAHPGHATTPAPGGPRQRRGSDREVEQLRSRLRAHPCHGCPDREDHARWAERWYKLHRDSQTLRRRIEQRTNTIARRFDRICEVLTELDYLVEDGGTTTVTAKGQRLMRIYAELDLVASEAIEHGLWSELSPSGLAAALSALVYESRRADDAGPPRLPGGPVKQALAETVRLWGDLEELQREHKIEFSREPDLAFAWAAYRWAEGDDLDEVLDATDLAAGDFVRWVKQLVDLAGQVADAAGHTALRDTARETVALLRRGVVAYSSVSS
jgi:ATP-dependent RNA helicase HelY